MNRRTTGALTRHTPAERAHLTLVTADDRRPVLPEAVSNAARIDPSILDPAPSPVGHLQRRDNFPCVGRVTYNYEDADGQYYVGSYPDFGADPDIEEELLALMGRIQAAARARRRADATRHESDA